MKIYVDGACKGNPGPSGIGVVILNNKGEAEKKLNKYIGIATNNIAEYEALIEMFAILEKYYPKERSITVYSDSELVVKQITGLYEVKDNKLKILYDKVTKLIERLERFSIKHIDRKKNKEADLLAKGAIKDRLDDCGSLKIIES